MTKAEILKQEILKQYKSVRQFAIDMEIPYSTLVTALDRGIEGMAYGTVIRMCDRLSLNPRVEMTDNQFGVEDLESGQGIAQVAGGQHLAVSYGDGGAFVNSAFDNLLEVYLLQVKNDVGNVFLNAGNGVKLVLHSVDADRGDGKAFKRVQENATQGIANSNSVAGLQWLELKAAKRVVCFEHHYFVRFLKC